MHGKATRVRIIVVWITRIQITGLWITKIAMAWFTHDRTVPFSVPMAALHTSLQSQSSMAMWQSSVRHWSTCRRYSVVQVLAVAVDTSNFILVLAI